MDLKAPQLTSHLQQGPLATVYCLSSDTPLLAQEARDQIRRAAAQQGYTQYELHTVTTAFNWQACFDTLQHYSLFAEKQLIDLRHPNAKFDKAAAQSLTHYLAHPNPDAILLITTDKLSSAQKRSQWFKAIDAAGITMTLWPIGARELPRWIQQRLQQTSHRATPEAIQLLATLTEGNLLATQQAIEKLILCYPNTQFTPEHIQAIVSDNAKFNVFDLTNYCLAGNGARAIQIVKRLAEIGTEPTLVLWSLTREIRELSALALQIQHGISTQQALSKQWASRKTLLQTALNRFTYATINQLLALAASVDRSIKGLNATPPWEALTTLAAALAGNPIIHSEKAL